MSVHIHPFANTKAYLLDSEYDEYYAPRIDVIASDFKSFSPFNDVSCATSFMAPPSRLSRRTRADRSNGTYVLQEHKITLTLLGQRPGIDLPVYGHEDVVDGNISLRNTSGILKVEAHMDGFVTVREIAGNGAAKTMVLARPLVLWERITNHSDASCPKDFSFSANLPTCYTNDSGQRAPLPPSFSERLSTMPGFRCTVEYAITVSVTRVRERAGLWRKHIVLRTPFQYRPRTRPSRLAPLPVVLPKCPSEPATLFVSSIKSRSPKVSPIVTHLYLPCSQICSMNAPITFYLKLSSSEHPLDAFTAFSTPGSFLPFGDSDHSFSSLSLHSAPAPSHSSSSAIRLSLVRQVSADAGSSCTWISDRSGTPARISKATPIGEGILLRSTKGVDSVTWVGEIRLCPNSKVQCGGFRTEHLTVQDALVLSIGPPDPWRSPLLEMRQVIPMYLTTDPYDCQVALEVCTL